MPHAAEHFRPFEAHCDASDGQAFLDAADLIDAGGSVEQGYELLSPRHRTSLFRAENRPPLMILLDAGREAPALLRKLADNLKDEA